MRLPSGGRIDRARALRFTWEGRGMTGYAGDTLASALLANSVRVLARSFKYHRPRGVWGAWTEEPNAIVDLVHGDLHDPNARATTVLLEEGMAARGVNAWPSVAFDLGGGLDLLQRFLPAGFYYKTFMSPRWGAFEGPIRRLAGLGRARATPDTRHFASEHRDVDVLVVGAGPAGLAAARAVRSSGLSVLLADDRPEPGGSLLWRGGTIDGMAAADWAAAQAGEALLSASVFGAYDHMAFGLLRRLPAQAGWASEALLQLRARQAILATGAIERPMVFPHNDRPGILSAEAVLQYLRLYGVCPGRMAVVATGNDSAYATAHALAEAGADVAVADLREAPGAVADAARAAGLRVWPGSAVHGTGGRGGLRWVDIGPADAPAAGRTMRVPADLLAVSGGAAPAVHLWSQARGGLRWNDAAQAFLPARAPAGFHIAGAAAGAVSLAEALAQGHEAGIAAAAALGAIVRLDPPQTDAPPLPAPPRVIREVRLPGTRQWVDYQNDVTSKDIRLAAAENYASVEHLKRYTTLGMATDQGKTSNINGLSILAAATNRDIPSVGTTTFRPPFTPVSLGALAGLKHGALYAPLRRLPAHARHVAIGALLRDYGGWQRPACYPRLGEDEMRATAREAAAARAGTGLFDGSSLGKIIVDGPDAAAFLNLMFYNEVANLKPGRLRYCLLLRETGIVYDDGVVARLEPDRYLLSPSSSHTAGVLSMLELWHQTEYPAMRVTFHDVTAAWATFAVSGSGARAAIDALGLGVDLSDATLPHMSLIAQDRLRIARVSFSGERSYEISVPAGEGAGLWERLLAQPDVKPYGIEALSVLRTEKGYIMIGTDSDGMTLPADLGVEAPLRNKTIDFVGRRSLLTEDALRPDRRQFVGLLPQNPDHIPHPGSHVLDEREGARRSAGWVTSACRSPALGRAIALGMVEGGRARVGEVVTLFHLGATSRATIVAPCFLDPKGERLHG